MVLKAFIKIGDLFCFGLQNVYYTEYFFNLNLKCATSNSLIKIRN